MAYNKGDKMIQDWFLQVLLMVIGIIAGGALWYFISQQQYHQALWCGTIAAIILIVVIALFVRNELLKTEMQAKTPVYFGELVPSNDPSPPLPKDAPKGTITLMLGDDLRVLAAQSENYILSKKGGTAFLSIGIKDNAMRLSASVFDSDNQNIVRIINNEFQASPERAFNPKQPDKHSLVVRDSKGVEVLNVRFLNPKAMRIVGRFQIPGIAEAVQILPDEGLRFPGGGGIGHLTLDVTASKGGVIAF